MEIMQDAETNCQLQMALVLPLLISSHSERKGSQESKREGKVEKVEGSPFS